jgi:hypothetical protein
MSFATACILICVLANRVAAQTNALQVQVLTLPAKGMPYRFADLHHNGRSDLLAINPGTDQLLIYRQRATGFTNAPDQILALPPQTAWIAPYSVRRQTNLDLLIATPIGLQYYAQTGGVFESIPRILIAAPQAFTNVGPPRLLATLTNSAIPIIAARQAWLFQRNEFSEWTSSPPFTLQAAHPTLSGHRNAWTFGQNSAYGIDIQQTFRSKPDEAPEEKPENDLIAKLTAEMKKAGPWNQPQIARVDLNHDGQLDFILWQVVPDSFRTEVYVFLRDSAGQLPERPSQVLHCRGVPIPIGSQREANPVADLKGDGEHELVLLEPDIRIISASGLVDAVLSRGVDVALTIRSFKEGAFSRNAEISIPLTALLSWFGSRQWPFFIHGDFNGDGRPDLVIQRSSTRWDVFLSTKDGRWFQSQPAMSFEIPQQGYFERRFFDIADLNGDGCSDIVSHDLDDPRMFIFLTQSSHLKGTP